MPKVIWLLRLFAKIWIGLAVVLVALSAVAILVLRGWTAFAEVFDPFNFWNTGLIILTLMPAFAAEKWASVLEERLPLTEEAASKIVQAYGAALEQRQLVGALTTPSALPAPKERIKAALRLAAARSVQDKAHLGVLGAAYIMLSDFQPDPSTMDSRMAEMIALKAEWNKWLQELNTSTR